MERLNSWLQTLGLTMPFMMMSLDGGKTKLNWTRIIEAGIIAIAGGLLAGFISVRELSVEIRLANQYNHTKNEEQDKRIDILCDKLDKVKDLLLDVNKK